MDELTKANYDSCRKACELCPGELIGKFAIADYVLFAAVLVVSAGIGVYYMVREFLASKKSTAEDVLMGGRDIGIFPIAMSLMASFMSAITVLGTPTEMYNNNTSYWIAGLAMIPTTVATVHVFLPFYHNLNLTSAYEVRPLLIVYSLCLGLTYCKFLCFAFELFACPVSAVHSTSSLGVGSLRVRFTGPVKVLSLRMVMKS